LNGPKITKITGTGAAGTNTNVVVTDGALTVTLHLLNQYASEFVKNPAAYTLTPDGPAPSAGTIFQLASRHPDNLATGTHALSALATDAAGNVGHSSNEAILGSSGLDNLVGTSGNDVIVGNGGNDKIAGNAGADTLTGGSGKVKFVYNEISDSTPSSHDTITDFNHGQDKIDFTNIAGINANGGIPAFQGKLTGTGNLTLNAHSVAYIEINGNTDVLVNTTNTPGIVTSTHVGAANMEIVLVGINLELTGADFHHL
jgi:Ca2+-binding RTX toxin-like protein